MKKNIQMKGFLHTAEGTTDVTIIELLSKISIRGTATVRLLKDDGNIVGAKVGHVLKMFQIDRFLKFSEIVKLSEMIKL